MPNSSSRKAYLVSPIGAEGEHGPVYAVVTNDPAHAVSAVAANLGTVEAALSFAGVLSRRMAHHLGLKPGKVRQI